MRIELIDAQRTMKRGKELFRSKRNWIQKTYAENFKGDVRTVRSEDACRFCLNGVLQRATLEMETILTTARGLKTVPGDVSVRSFRSFNQVLEILGELIEFDYEEAKRFEPHTSREAALERSIERWNDNADRTHSEVIELLNKGIAKTAALIEAA